MSWILNIQFSLELFFFCIHFVIAPNEIYERMVEQKKNTENNSTKENNSYAGWVSMFWENVEDTNSMIFIYETLLTNETHL